MISNIWKTCSKPPITSIRKNVKPQKNHSAVSSRSPESARSPLPVPRFGPVAFQATLPRFRKTGVVDDALPVDSWETHFVATGWWGNYLLVNKYEQLLDSWETHETELQAAPHCS